MSRVPTEKEKKAREQCITEEAYARYRTRERYKPLGTNDISISSYKAICDSLGVKVSEAGM